MNTEVPFRGGSSRPFLTLLIPCYNESAVLAETYRRIKGVVSALNEPCEIVLVNDGSEDDTLVQMVQLANQDTAIVVLNLSRNHGHQLALSAGLQYCTGQRVLIMDADLQDPPELVPQMLRLMEGGADVVYAQRRTRSGDQPLKRLACAFFYRLLSRLSDAHIPLDVGDFRMISRRVVDLLLQMPERHRYLRGMVSWVGFRQVPLLYDRDRRFAGKTKYPFHRLLALALDGIAASSTRPLALASYAGVLFAAAGIVLIAYALFSWWKVGKTPQGWTSLMVVITVMGSVQLFVLGIIGQYLGRIHEQIRGRPLFIVDRVYCKGNWANPSQSSVTPNQPGAELQSASKNDLPSSQLAV
jgi:glycosyltransferase involved in cell wall biosynthesis